MLYPTSFKKPVVFFTNGIGDHLIVLPTLRSLSSLFNGKLSIVCSESAYRELFSDINFQSTWSIPFLERNNSSLYMKACDRILFDAINLSQQIKHCDLFISLATWESASLTKLLEILSPNLTLGYFPNYSYFINGNNLNAFDRYFASAQIFEKNLEIEPFSQSPILTKKNKSLASSLKQELGINHKLLVVHTDTKKRKMWSEEKFLETIDKFLSLNSNYLVVIVGNYHKIPMKKALNKNRIFSLCNIPIGLSFAVVSVADLFLGIDSCMLHAADLFRIPSVGLFGPTNPKRWGCRFTQHKHIKAQQLDSIDSEQVVKALCELSKLSDEYRLKVKFPQ